MREMLMGVFYHTGGGDKLMVDRLVALPRLIL